MRLYYFHLSDDQLLGFRSREAAEEYLDEHYGPNWRSQPWAPAIRETELEEPDAS